MSLTLYALSADYQAVIEAAENAGTPEDEQAFRDNAVDLRVLPSQGTLSPFVTDRAVRFLLA